MILENELRIGNYVLGQTKQITKVDGFFNNNKAIYTNVEDERVRFIIHYLNECEGIELTEEILLKCGFKFEKYFYRIYINEYSEFILAKENGDNIYYLCDIDINVNIKYLHQLQNLYFALTGKELNIEL